MLVMTGAPPTIVSDRLQELPPDGRAADGRGHGGRPGRVPADGQGGPFPHVMMMLDWGDRWFRAPGGPAILLTHTTWAATSTRSGTAPPAAASCTAPRSRSAATRPNPAPDRAANRSLPHNLHRTSTWPASGRHRGLFGCQDGRRAGGSPWSGGKRLAGRGSIEQAHSPSSAIHRDGNRHGPRPSTAPRPGYAVCRGGAVPGSSQQGHGHRQPPEQPARARMGPRRRDLPRGGRARRQDLRMRRREGKTCLGLTGSFDVISKGGVTPPRHRADLRLRRRRGGGGGAGLGLPRPARRRVRAVRRRTRT